jgi:hypothetical protein
MRFGSSSLISRVGTGAGSSTSKSIAIFKEHGYCAPADLVYINCSHYVKTGKKYFVESK